MNQMKLLAIDTSTERASVALAIKNDVYSDEQSSLRQHALCLLPMIDGLLRTAGIELSELDGIVFGRGPGSFTGLRVACSIAKALAYAHNVPLFPVSSLAAIADEVYETEPDLAVNTRVLAMLDARMHQVYWADFSREDCFPVEQVTAAKDIKAPSVPCVIAGVGLHAYALELALSLHEPPNLSRIIYPAASAMIRLVRRGLVLPVGVDQALPVYVRELHF